MKIKTQFQYDKEDRAKKKLKQQLFNKQVTREQAIGQMCLFGYSADRASKVIAGWYDDFDRHFPS